MWNNSPASRTPPRFSYDKGGNLTKVTDNRGNTLWIEYGLLDQETRRTEKDGGVTRRINDQNDRRTRLVLPMSTSG